MDLSHGEEQKRQEDPTPEAPADPLITPAYTLVSLQDLQESIVISPAASPSSNGAHLQESTTPPPARVLQEPIAASSATIPPEKMAP